MSRMTINLHPEVEGSSINRVQRTLNDMGAGDEVTINIEATDAHQADPIIDLLNEGGFEHAVKGSHNGRNYYITARRKLH